MGIGEVGSSELSALVGSAEMSSRNTPLTSEVNVRKTPRRNLIGKLINYRNRFFSALEQVFVDEKDVEIDLEENLNILSGNAPKYDKAVAVFRIARNYLPEEKRQQLEERFVYSQGKMPFSPEDYQLKTRIGSGGVNDVFLLDSQKADRPSYVLKVNRLSGTEKRFGQLAIAKEQKDEYLNISSYFEDISGLIPEEQYVIMHGPRRGSRVVVMLQEFVGERLRDVFVDLSKDELAQILTGNVELKGQLSKFLEIIRTNKELTENEIDILGKNNLAIVGDEGRERLLFLDPHFRSENVREWQSKKEMEERLQYLEEALELHLKVA